jgi:hypothetical protein
MAGNTSLTRTYNRIFTIMRDEAIEPYLFDNISSRTSLLYCLKEKGAIKKIGGAPHLRFNILKELPTTEGYTDLDAITPVRADPATSAIYDWKQLQCPVQVSGLDMIKTGDDAAPDLLEMFIQAAEISMRDAIGGSSVGIYSSGADSDTNKITGLQTHFTSSTTTGQVGNISRATLTAWRHQSANVSSAFDTNGLIRMRTLYRQCSRADETPDIVVLNGSTWDNFNRELTSTFHVNLPLADVGAGSKGMLDAGFPNLRWFGALLFHDDGVPDNAGYFINSDYVQLYVREGRDAEISDFIKSSDRDDLAAFVFWAGNLINKNLARGGVLLNGDTY